MGKGVHRLGDMTAGHGCWPPTQATSASTDVFVNGRGVVRQGDPILPHTCPSTPPQTHGGTFIGGGTVFVNGKAVQTIGSPVSCGDTAAGGSGDVFVGGGA